MDLIQSNENVPKMLELYEEKRSMTITVMKGKTHDFLGKDINIGDGYETQVLISEIGVPIVYEINDHGVLFPSQGSSQAESSNPVHADDSQADYLITQQSCNLQKDKGKEIVIVNDNEQDILSQFLDEFADDVVEEQPMEEEVPNVKKI